VTTLICTCSNYKCSH